MKLKFLLLLILSGILLTSCSNKKRSGDPQVLLFHKTAGYHHKCISSGSKAIKEMCAEHNIQVETTDDPSCFNEKTLSEYAAVIFFNTTGDVLDAGQENAFERYIQSGGGYVGVHSASDTEYKWEWYGQMVGAYFISHPKIQEAKFIVQDTSFGATSFLPNEWIRTDELYNFKLTNPDVNVVLTVDESSYVGGINGEYHPMAWYHDYDGGRAFYTALGHTHDSYKEEFFMRHLVEGIKYAIGDNKKLDYSKARTISMVNSDRFSKVPLSMGQFDEPTEMTVLPNLDVLIAERSGGLKMYNAATKELTDVGRLEVYDESGVDGVNAEEGFIGLQADPNYADNQWLYTYYAPEGNLAVNRLSRFKFLENKLQMETEQVILDVASDRQICCHTGGSIAFGPGGLLYLSTGDNSTPFDDEDAEYVNNGFAPLNDLPGKKQYDARRSSANTNDLRGKILRIKVEEDGTYTIPDGNLFPVGTELTRPEIYTMGHRNPYRISVDPHKGYVYWGDVGPDAADDDLKNRGPKGYDEMNQAREPGNYGWPLFIGNNKPYVDYDYSNGQSGATFDPLAPINDSRNNTGLRELPPAQGAFVYYPYDKSSDFDGLASGGRNAMAGPTYYTADFEGDQKLPDAYDGKVFIYDWMRGWMKAVTLNEDGSYKKMEPFASDVKLNNLIDMELGPNGQLYLLEYGTGWFVQNDDSGLSVIEYNPGNRAPKIKTFVSNISSGKSPLTVEFDVESEDPESDHMTYNWNFGDDQITTTKTPKIVHTYTEPGMYKAQVEVLDEEGLVTKSGIVNIVSGNTRPEIKINLQGVDAKTYALGQEVSYNVNVVDAEDGQEIDLSKIHVSVDYVDGFDEASVATGHQEVSDISLGESLVKNSICRSCHKVNEASIGPSYTEIADKYNAKSSSSGYLRSKIINGGTGVWGENVMPANSDAKPADVKKMIKYILSLTKEDDKNRLPPKGKITPAKNSEGKVMVVSATYTDNGAEGSHPLTGSGKAILHEEKGVE
jgi:glucose/arabinose dehydrogenase/cytochrome c551/c552